MPRTIRSFTSEGARIALTPFYDVISAWPIIGRGANLLDARKAKLALAVRSRNAHWKLTEIKARHWDSVARDAGLGDANDLLAETAGQVGKVIAEVVPQLPRGFPSRVADRIFSGLQGAARQVTDSV